MTHQGTTSALFTAFGRLARRYGAPSIALALVLGWTQAAAAACPSCGTSPCTISGTSTIASGATCDYSGKDVILTGTLQGDDNAACYTVIANNLTVRGTLRARSSCIYVQVAGNFKMEIVSNSAATVDVRDADNQGDGLFVECGSATLNGNAINADADGTDVPAYYSAGWIWIKCSGDISGTGGPFHVVGSGGDGAGDVDIESLEGAINLASAFDLSGGGEFSDGGWLILDASDDVTVGTSSRSIQAQGAQGGSGGAVDISAGGTATINGAINVNGNGVDAYGGDISVNASVISTGTTWSTRGDDGGSGGGIALGANSGAGTITIASTSAWYVNGNGGGSGGTVGMDAVGNVTLNGDIDARGLGADAWGGDVWISTSGDVAVGSTSRIEADGSGLDATDGTISMSACDITVAGTLDTRRPDIFGRNDFVYAGTYTQAAGSVFSADDGYGNTFTCRCVDTSPADGTCDSPASCVSNPTLNGTVNPSATLTPQSMASCS